MRTLIALAVVLVASVGVFLWRGLPATADLRQAHSEMLAREQHVQRRWAELDPMSGEELAALLAERDRAAAVADRRVDLLEKQDSGAKSPSLADFVQSRELTAFSPVTPLGASLAAQAAGSARGDEVLAAIVSRLAEVPDLTVSELTLANGGLTRAVPGVPEWLSVEAQLVVTTGVPEALACLESLGPDGARGLPMLTVQTASLRRIEPERWGSDAHERRGPPVQLSATLAVYVRARPTGEG
jgi:hypothetical protein